MENTYELANEFFAELQRLATSGEYFELPRENQESLFFKFDILLPQDMKSISTLTCQGKSGHISEFLCPWCDCASAERGDPSIFLCSSCADRPNFKADLVSKLSSEEITDLEKFDIQEVIGLIEEDEKHPCCHIDIFTGKLYMSFFYMIMLLISLYIIYIGEQQRECLQKARDIEFFKKIKDFKYPTPTGTKEDLENIVKNTLKLPPAYYERFRNKRGNMTKECWDQIIKEFLQMYKLSPIGCLTASEVIKLFSLYTYKYIIIKIYMLLYTFT